MIGGNFTSMVATRHRRLSGEEVEEDSEHSEAQGQVGPFLPSCGDLPPAMSLHSSPMLALNVPAVLLCFRMGTAASESGDELIRL